MNHGSEPGHASQLRFTPKQGQYLAFIHAYMLVLGRPPAEADLRRHFRVTPPSVHQMLVTLEREGFIRRQPGVARSILVWVRVLAVFDPSGIGALGSPGQHAITLGNQEPNLTIRIFGPPSGGAGLSR